MPTRRRDIETGTRFGHLVVLGLHHENPAGFRSGSGNDVRFWLCRCDCGREVVVGSKNLRPGVSSSCGCVPKGKPPEDLTGRRFGRLVVLRMEPRGKYAAEGIIWRCLCDCGAEVSVRGHNLRNGQTRSCGCLRDERFARTREAR